jgi:hypothetical protein
VQSSPIHAISPESVSQAGAGALLLAFGLIELALGFWADGWWHGCGALLVASIGAACLIRGLAAMARDEPAAA